MPENKLMVNGEWKETAVLLYCHTAEEEENGRGVRDTGIYNYTFFGGKKNVSR